MNRSLKQIALVVTGGTLLSKIGGMGRQLAIASVFGVGAAYDAYNYAYVLPGFLLILFGGINGPLHSSMVSVLSKRPDKEKAYLLTALNSIMGVLLFILTIILIIFSDPLIKILGPGLNNDIHRIAVIQLQIMAPIAFLSGLIGLGFGSLSASEEFWIPSISPLMSSLCIIIGIVFFANNFGEQINPELLALKGGINLAIATLIGALLQLLIQIPTLVKRKLIKFKLIFNWGSSGVREILKILFPATLSSGMLQINVCTDLLFASQIAGAASGLSYANLLVQAPLGIISNALLVPLLPAFAKLTNYNDRPKLINRIRQGLIISLASMIVLSALFIVLANPIVTLIYQRGAFNENAVKLVSSILIAYGLGLPAYLIRDLLVRVFYAIGDASTPFRLSLAGIFLNAFFDWIFVGAPTPWGNQIPYLNFGASGLVFATAGINCITCAALIMILHFKLGGLPLSEWGLNGSKIFLTGFVSGFLGWIMRKVINWPPNTLGTFLEVTIISGTCICLFGIICSSLGIKELSNPFRLLRQKTNPF